MDAKVLGARIARLRREQGLSQDDLADQMTVDQGLISRWENGIRRPGITKLPLLAKLLNTSVDDLLSCEEPAA